MRRLRGFAASFVFTALALFASTVSADPFTPSQNIQSTEPVVITTVQTPDGEMLHIIFQGASKGYCGGDPVNRIDPMGTDYIYEQNGYVFYQGQKMSGGKGKGNNFRRDAGKPVAIGTTDGTYIKLFQGVGGGIVHQATFERAAVQTLSGAATCAGINAVIQRAYGMDAPSATPGYDRAIAFTQGVRTTSIVAGTVVAVAATGGAAATAYTAYGTTGVLAVGAQTTTQVAVGVGTAVVAKSGLEAVGVPEDFAQPLSEATSLGVTYKASGLINSLIPIKSYVNNVEITETVGPLANRIPTVKTRNEEMLLRATWDAFNANPGKRVTEGSEGLMSGTRMFAKSGQPAATDFVVPEPIPGLPEPGVCGMPKSAQLVNRATPIANEPIMITTGGFRRVGDQILFKTNCQHCLDIIELNPRLVPSTYLPPGVPRGLPPSAEVPFNAPEGWE